MVVTYQHLLSKKLAAKIHEANVSHWEYATVYIYKDIYVKLENTVWSEISLATIA